MAMPLVQPKVQVTQSKQVLTRGMWEKKHPYSVKFTTSPFEFVVTLEIGDIKYKIKDILWKHAPNLSEKELKDLAINFKERFEVKIIHIEGTTTYRAEITIKTPTTPRDVFSLRKEKDSNKRNEMLTLLSIQNAQELVIATKQNYDPLFPTIFHKMADGFCALPIPTEAAVAEMIEISEFLSDEDKQRVIEKFIQEAYHGIILSESMLKGLTEILNRFQNINYRNSLEKAIKDPTKDPIVRLSENPLNVLTSDNLVQLMDAIVAKLKQAHDSPETTLIYLQGLIALLDVMMIVGTTGLSREKHHTKFLEVVKGYISHKDIRVSFLANYGEESFKVVKNDESKTHATVRRGLHVLKGLAIIGGSVDLKQPWQVLGAIDDAAGEFKKAFENIQGWKQDWFVGLILIQQLFLKEPKALLDFQAKIGTDEKEIKKTFPASNSLFVQGLVFLLQKAIDFYAAEQPTISEAAIMILEKIAIDNISANERKSPRPLFRADSHSKKIESWISKSLTRYLNHLNSDIAKKAKKSMCNIFQAKNPLAVLPPELVSKELIPSEITSLPSLIVMSETLFKRAIAAAAPWVAGMSSLAERLEADSQIREEKDYVMTLKGKESELEPDIRNEKMESRLAKVLEDRNNKVVVILGDSGSGKTLFSKLFVLNQLSTYDSSKPIPLFVSLNTLKDPVQNLMGELLKQLKLPDNEELQKKTLHVFCDGFDELYIGGRRPNEGLANLYSANHLKTFWPNVQLIISCRKDFLSLSNDDNCFLADGGKSKKLYVAPFQKADIEKTYVPTYVRVKKEKEEDDKSLRLETADYLQYFNELSLWTTIYTPFYLRVTMDTLPTIVAMLKKTKKPMAVTKEILFDEYICQRFLLEFTRQLTTPSAPLKEITDYLIFALELSRNMQKCKVISVSCKDQKGESEKLRKNANLYIREQKDKINKTNEKLGKLEAEQKTSSKKTLEEKKKIEEEYQDLKADIKTFEENINEAISAPERLIKQLFGEKPMMNSLRRAAFLVHTSDDTITFIHPSMYDHFRAIDTIPRDRKRIEKRLEEVRPKIS